MRLIALLVLLGAVIALADYPVDHITDVEGHWRITSNNVTACVLLTAKTDSTIVFYHPELGHCSMTVGLAEGSSSLINCGGQYTFGARYIAKPDNTRHVYVSKTPDVVPPPEPGPDVNEYILTQCDLRESFLIGETRETYQAATVKRDRSVDIPESNSRLTASSSSSSSQSKVDPVYGNRLASWAGENGPRMMFSLTRGGISYDEEFELHSSRGKRVTDEGPDVYFLYMVMNDGSVLITYSSTSSSDPASLDTLTLALGAPEQQYERYYRLSKPPMALNTYTTVPGWSYSPDWYTSASPVTGGYPACHERTTSTNGVESYTFEGRKCTETYGNTQGLNAGIQECENEPGSEAKTSIPFVFTYRADGSIYYQVPSTPGTPFNVNSPFSKFVRQYILYPCTRNHGLRGSWRMRDGVCRLFSPINDAATNNDDTTTTTATTVTTTHASDMAELMDKPRAGPTSGNAFMWLVDEKKNIVVFETPQQGIYTDFMNEKHRFTYKVDSPILITLRINTCAVGSVSGCDDSLPPTLDQPGRSFDEELVLDRCVGDRPDALFGYFRNQANEVIHARPNVTVGSKGVYTREIGAVGFSSFVQQDIDLHKGTIKVTDGSYEDKGRFFLSFSGSSVEIIYDKDSAETSTDTRHAAYAGARIHELTPIHPATHLTRGAFAHTGFPVCVNHNSTNADNVGMFFDPRPISQKGKGFCYIAPSSDFNGGVFVCGPSNSTGEDKQYVMHYYELFDAETESLYLISGAGPLSNMILHSTSDAHVWRPCPLTHSHLFVGNFRGAVVLPPNSLRTLTSFDLHWGDHLPQLLDTTAPCDKQEPTINQDDLIHVTGRNDKGDKCTFAFSRDSHVGWTNCVFESLPPTEPNTNIMYQYRLTHSGFILLLVGSDTTRYPPFRDIVPVGGRVIVLTRCLMTGAIQLAGPKYSIQLDSPFIDFKDSIVKVTSQDAFSVVTDDDKTLPLFDITLDTSNRVTLVRSQTEAFYRGYFNILPDESINFGVATGRDPVPSSDSAHNYRVSLRQPMRNPNPDSFGLLGAWAPAGAKSYAECRQHVLEADKYAPSFLYNDSTGVLVRNTLYMTALGRGLRTRNGKSYPMIYRINDNEGNFVVAVSKKTVEESPAFPLSFEPGLGSNTIVERYIPCFSRASVTMTNIILGAGVPEPTTPIGLYRFFDMMSSLTGIHPSYYTNRVALRIPNTNPTEYQITFTVHAGSQSAMNSVNIIKNAPYDTLDQYEISNDRISYLIDDRLTPDYKPSPDGDKNQGGGGIDISFVVTLAVGLTGGVICLTLLGCYVYRRWKRKEMEKTLVIAATGEGGQFQRLDDDMINANQSSYQPPSNTSNSLNI